MNRRLSERIKKLEVLLTNSKLKILNKREYAIQSLVQKLCELQCTTYVRRPVFSSSVYYVGEHAIGGQRVGICEDCVQREHVWKTNEGRFLCSTCLNGRPGGGFRTEYTVTGFKSLTKVIDKKKKSQLIDELVAALIFNLVGDYTNLPSSLERWIRKKPALFRKRVLSTLAKMGLHVVLAERIKTKKTENVRNLHLPESYIQALDQLVNEPYHPNGAEAIRAAV